MSTVSQSHRTFSDRGQLLDGDNSPIEVNYSIVLSFRPQETGTLGGPGMVQWEPDSAEGFIKLVHRSDWSRVEVPGNYTLAMKDGKRCLLSLNYSGEPTSGKYLVKCSPQDLV